MKQNTGFYGMWDRSCIFSFLICQAKFLIYPGRLKPVMMNYYCSKCNWADPQNGAESNPSRQIFICMDRWKNKICMSYLILYPITSYLFPVFYQCVFKRLWILQVCNQSLTTILMAPDAYSWGSSNGSHYDQEESRKPEERDHNNCAE